MSYYEAVHEMETHGARGCGKARSHLHISKLLLLLPVPHRQNVVIGVVHNTQEASPVLQKERKGGQMSAGHHTHC